MSSTPTTPASAEDAEITPAPEPVMTAHEVKALLRCSSEFLAAQIHSGNLPAYRLGPGSRAPFRFRREDVDRMLYPVVPSKTDDTQ